MTDRGGEGLGSEAGGGPKDKQQTSNKTTADYCDLLHSNIKSRVTDTPEALIPLSTTRHLTPLDTFPCYIPEQNSSYEPNHFSSLVTPERRRLMARPLYFLRATKKNEGVKISNLPPSQRSMAVAFRRADTLVDPAGAIPIVSKVVTMA